MLRVLLIGDLHFKYSDKSNHKDTDELTIQLINIAKSISNLDKIVVLGDTLDAHERIHISQMTRAIKLLEQLVEIAPLVILIGNHDRVNPEEFLTDQSPFYALKKWPNTIVADTVQYEEIKGKRLLYVPYVSPGRFVEAIETKLQSSEWKTCNVIFGHQDFKGATDNDGFELPNGDDWYSQWPRVYSGHIHKSHRLDNGVVYVGTPYQTRHGECANKHVMLIELMSGSRDILEHYIPTNVTKKITKKIDISQLDTLTLSEDEKKSNFKLVIMCSSSDKTVRKHKKIKETAKAVNNFSLKIKYTADIQKSIVEEIDNDECQDKDLFFIELEKMISSDTKQLEAMRELLA